MRTLIFVTTLLLAISAAAHDCISTVVYIHAFDSRFDQLQMLERLAFEGVLAETASVNAGRQRYLVVTTLCDAYYGLQQERGSVGANAIVIPDDHPFEWQHWSDIANAAAEYASHTDAQARGIKSLRDGSIVVYWTKAKR